MDWQSIKQQGSDHYKSGITEPIDLYKAGGFLQQYCVASIIKYAYRNRDKMPVVSDMEKIKHLAEMMICLTEESQPQTARDLYSGYTPEDLVIKHKGD